MAKDVGRMTRQELEDELVGLREMVATTDDRAALLARAIPGLTLAHIGLLLALLGAQGRTLSPMHLAGRVCVSGVDLVIDPEGLVRTHISRLRRLLGTESPIETVPHVGYRIGRAQGEAFWRVMDERLAS